VIEILEKRILDKIVTEIDDGEKEPISAADHVIEKHQLEVKLTDEDLIYLIECLNLRKPKESAWMRVLSTFMFALVVLELSRVIVGFSQTFLQFLNFFGSILMILGFSLSILIVLGDRGGIGTVEKAIETFNYELLKMKREEQSK